MDGLSRVRAAAAPMPTRQNLGGLVGAARLKAQATIGAGGFESATTLPVIYAYVAIQALDSAGAVLGISRTVTVAPA